MADEFNRRDEAVREIVECFLGSNREIHVHLHVSPITVNVVNPPVVSVSTATRALLNIGGPMPGAITVDTTNETATVSFLDDKGDSAEAPAGLSVTFSSDNEAVATVVQDSVNPLQGNINPVSIGTANISCSLNGALEGDGVTPIPDPAPAAVSVAAGPAASASLVLNA